jgi:hypothetical protein
MICFQHDPTSLHKILFLPLIDWITAEHFPNFKGAASQKSFSTFSQAFTA